MSDFTLRVTFEYKQKTFTTNVLTYKKVSYLLKQAKNFFFPIYPQIKLMYKNMDISSSYNELIGSFFKNKNSIYIRVVPIEFPPISKGPKRAPSPTLRQSKNDSIRLKLCSCNRNYISFFCRNCSKFRCSSCIDDQHSSHSNFRVNNINYEDTVKLYAITLEAEIANNSRTVKEYYKKFQSENFIDVSTRNEMIIRKINQLMEKYTELINILSLGNMEEIQNIIQNYQNDASILKTEINNIVAKFYKKKKNISTKMTFDELYNIMSQLNAKEKEHEQKVIDIFSYRVNFDLSAKMEEIYKEIDEIIDFNLKAEIPLNLNPKSYSMLLKVKNAKKEINITNIDNILNDEEQKSHEENVKEFMEHKSTESNVENESNLYKKSLSPIYYNKKGNVEDNKGKDVGLDEGNNAKESKEINDNENKEENLNHSLQVDNEEKKDNNDNNKEENAEKIEVQNEGNKNEKKNEEEEKEGEGEQEKEEEGEGEAEEPKEKANEIKQSQIQEADMKVNLN